MLDCTSAKYPPTHPLVYFCSSRLSVSVILNTDISYLRVACARFSVIAYNGCDGRLSDFSNPLSFFPRLLFFCFFFFLYAFQSLAQIFVIS